MAATVSLATAGRLTATAACALAEFDLALYSGARRGEQFSPRPSVEIPALFLCRSKVEVSTTLRDVVSH